MKPNEAPKKIQIVIDRSWGGMVVNYDRNDPENIEYTRTGAFKLLRRTEYDTNRGVTQKR